MFECKICEYKETDGILNAKTKHLRTHKLTNTQYNKKFKIKRPSVWSKYYWMSIGLSVEESVIKVREYQQSNSSKHVNNIKPEHSIFNKAYWIKKGYTNEAAIEEVRKLQAKNSSKSKKFKGKNHTKKSRLKISKSSKARAGTIGKENMIARFGPNRSYSMSNSEINCLNELEKYIGCIQRQVNIHGFNVDGLIDQLVIEFKGDYWHANPIKYKDDAIITGKTAKEIQQADYARRSAIKSYGYDVYEIWEYDWNNNKNKIITEICSQVELLKKKLK